MWIVGILLYILSWINCTTLQLVFLSCCNSEIMLKWHICSDSSFQLPSVFDPFPIFDCGHVWVTHLEHVLWSNSRHIRMVWVQMSAHGQTQNWIVFWVIIPVQILTYCFLKIYFNIFIFTSFCDVHLPFIFPLTMLYELYCLPCVLRLLLIVNSVIQSL